VISIKGPPDIVAPGLNQLMVYIATNALSGPGAPTCSGVTARARQSVTIGIITSCASPTSSRLRIAIHCDDHMIGHCQFQAGFKLSAEDLPVRLSATTS
jgi:hypothetical protein